MPERSGGGPPEHRGGGRPEHCGGGPPERNGGGPPERNGGGPPERRGTASAAGSAAAPRSLAELPFLRREPLALLGLQPGSDGTRRQQPDLDYAGFGWAELDTVVLEADDGTREPLGPALVLALHSPDEPDDPVADREPPEHLQLAFELPGSGPPGAKTPLVVLAPLPQFLAVWLPRLPATAPHVVLALCNPHHLELPRSSPGLRSLGSRQLHYAHGDVLSWLDLQPGSPAQIRLRAHTWHRR